MSTNVSRISQLVILIAVFLASGQTLWAQGKGYLKGRVTDSAGAAIEKTKIIVKSPLTQFETTVNKYGEFDVELPSGVYRIATNKMPGFVPFRRSGIRIRDSKTTIQDIRMKVTRKGLPCILTITAPATRVKLRAKNNSNQ